jgi:predicted nucleic acid-binding protein
MFVVDASAAVEYLLQTTAGVRVGELLAGSPLAAPELLDAEVLAVLRRLVLRGQLRPRRATEAVADLRDWGIERLAHRPLLDHAWLLRGHVTAYDALYVAAAHARHAALVTVDGPLARAPALGIVVHDVRVG